MKKFVFSTIAATMFLSTLSLHGMPGREDGRNPIQKAAEWAAENAEAAMRWHEEYVAKKREKLAREVNRHAEGTPERLAAQKNLDEFEGVTKDIDRLALQSVDLAMDFVKEEIQADRQARRDQEHLLPAVAPIRGELERSQRRPLNRQCLLYTFVFLAGSFAGFCAGGRL